MDNDIILGPTVGNRVLWKPCGVELRVTYPRDRELGYVYTNSLSYW